MSEDDTEPRHIPPGSCAWCGHPLHSADCSKVIRTGKKSTGPCPCARRDALVEGGGR